MEADVSGVPDEVVEDEPDPEKRGIKYTGPPSKASIPGVGVLERGEIYTREDLGDQFDTAIDLVDTTNIIVVEED